MSTVKMSKISVIGLNENKSNILKKLMKLGVIEIRDPAEKLQDKDWLELVQRDGDDDQDHILEQKLIKAKTALDTLAKYDERKKPLFYTRRKILINDYDKEMEEKEHLEEETNRIVRIHEKWMEEKTRENAIVADQIKLEPWSNCKFPLEIKETPNVVIYNGFLPVNAVVKDLRAKLEESTPHSVLTVYNTDTEQIYINIVAMKSEWDLVLETLKEYGYTEFSTNGFVGNVDENKERLSKELSENLKDQKRIEDILKEETNIVEKLQLYYDSLTMAYDQSKGLNSLLKTQKTFYFDGWISELGLKEAEELLEEYECYYQVEEADEDEITPVLLRNNNLIFPVESITEMYSLPSSKEVDPTPIFSWFYVLFFGMMFSDMAYGVILAGISTFAIFKYKLEGGTYKLVKTLAYCGVSTFIWGLLYGGLFGNLLTVISQNYFGKSIVITPLWFDPLENPMMLLVIACGLGVVHLFVGMGIKAYMQIKKGEFIQAINDNIIWYVFIIGLILLLFGSTVISGSEVVGKWMSIIGAAGILILPVFINKGAEKALGLWNLYGVTGYLADILSYSRILALGLSTAVIAQVVNTLGGLFGTSILSVVLFLLVGVLGHGFNFAISGLGAFVHSARLQYVEFFGKFYEGGGIPFRPFNRNTKYIRIIEEDKK